MRHLHPAYEATEPPPPPRVPSETPSMMARAARTPLARLLVIIAAACTGVAGVITATGAAVVNVIATISEANARRTNAEIDRRLDAVETRVNGGFGLPLETKTRIENEAKVADELTQIKARLTTCEAKK